MDFWILLLVSFGASWLTFFCGFGLGTMLTPVFYLLFNDLALAIAATAIVHFLNNVFKFFLMQRSVQWNIALPFGAVAIPAAFLGAWLLQFMSDSTLFSYELFDKTWNVLWMNLVFGIVLIVFALIELIPAWSLSFSKKGLWLGGLVSGFFGGLSGHQGALRSAFLIKYQLSKEAFVGTGIVIALTVDVVRISVYTTDYSFDQLNEESWIFVASSLGAALLGAITGKYFLRKIKINWLTNFVSIAMVVFGVLLMGGFLNK